MDCRLLRDGWLLEINMLEAACRCSMTERMAQRGRSNAGISPAAPYIYLFDLLSCTDVDTEVSAFCQGVSRICNTAQRCQHQVSQSHSRALKSCENHFRRKT